MKIQFIYVGKTTKAYLHEGEEEYIKRIKRYAPFETLALSDVKNAKNRSEDEIKKIEGERILEKISSTDFVILLDEKGKEMTSVGFSKWLQTRFLGGYPKLIFVIGGAYGFSPAVYNRANAKLALSKLTFSHQMVRVFFLEQLYRAFTILKGEPYHHQ